MMIHNSERLVLYVQRLDRVVRETRREAEVQYSQAGFPAEVEVAYEVVEFVEMAFQPGRSMPPPAQNVIGQYDTEDEAVLAARAAREHYVAEKGHRRDAWWLVRQPGSQLATWIADASSEREFVLDLRTGQLVEVE